jgi:hypothetical protein
VRAESFGPPVRWPAFWPLIAWLPMMGALAGGWVDERFKLGFTTWRSACRAAGLDLGSIASFTLQLLPAAVTGLLLGGLLVLGLAIPGRARPQHSGRCLAAHLACVMSLPVALLICASALPLPLMLLADFAVTAALALLLMQLMRRASRGLLPHP